MISLHASRTWVLSHALHPVIWVIWALLCSNGDLAAEGLFMCFAGLFISIPILYLFRALIRLIVGLGFSLPVKFSLWLIGAPLLIHICVTVLICLFDGVWESFYIVYSAIPAMIASVLAITIRYRQFFKLNKEAEKFISMSAEKKIWLIKKIRYWIFFLIIVLSLITVLIRIKQFFSLKDWRF